MENNGWIETKNQLPPQEWELVLGWGSRGYSLCCWYMHNSGKRCWQVDGRSGNGVTAPEFWKALPPSPWHSQQATANPDTTRYRWLRDWIRRDGKRSEIDPHGHIAVRTNEEWEELLDQAVERSAAQVSDKA